ncbi:unnamed protein product [Pylaiella littoralis]
MTSAAKGALSRSLRLEAFNNRHHQALWEGATERLHLQHKIQLMVLKISELETELGEIKDSLGGKADKAHPAAPGIARIDHSILIGKDSTQVRSLVGVSSHYSEQKLYEFLDAEGAAATHVVFYDKREGSGLKQTGERVSHRNGVFRGINGLFLTLMVLRTAVPLVVASTLFGVHETTVGRAFTTWLNFLCRSLRPLVRLPSIDEVDIFAPDNFVRYGYGKCALVLDATELEIPRSWQGDMNWACYSTYKGRQTAKVLVAVTPGGGLSVTSAPRTLGG